MGVPMTARLVAAGHEVRGYDTSANARERVGETAVGSLADAAAGAEAVVLMLAASDVVREVVLDEGLLDAIEPGVLVVDMGSSDPTQTRELAAAAASRGIGYVDAPVSGAVVGAEAGTLTIMFGGTAEELARCEPFFASLGKKIVHAGPVGAGHALKALNNYLAATAYAAAAEALEIGEAYGLDPAKLIEVVNTSTGRSFSSEHVYAEHVITGRYATGFAAGLLAKDVAIAADLARTAGIDAPTLELVSRRWADAVAEIGPGADHSEAHKPWYSARAVR
jgi:3-hydroxyisobutyrate dehydrogenase